MEGSKFSVRTWYLAMAFMTFSKKSISASELQRQLDHPKYDTVWRLMHKIRQAMGKRDALYQLDGAVEFDGGYFEAQARKGKPTTGSGSSNGRVYSVGKHRNWRTFKAMQVLQNEGC
jgi:hypothetical protein